MLLLVFHLNVMNQGGHALIESSSPLTSCFDGDDHLHHRQLRTEGKNWLKYWKKYPHPTNGHHPCNALLPAARPHCIEAQDA